MKNSVMKSNPKALHRTIMTEVTEQSKKWDPKHTTRIIPTSLRFDKKYQRIAVIKTAHSMKELTKTLRSNLSPIGAELNPAGCIEFVLGKARGFICAVPVTDEKTMISFYVAGYAMSKPNKALKKGFEQFQKLHDFSITHNVEFCKNPHTGEIYKPENLGFLADEVSDDEAPGDDID